MNLPQVRITRLWQKLSPGMLPFADAASVELPLPRLLRLSLFQVSVGLASALLVGTLNRVMIVELGVAAWLVSAMVALPLLAAPWRALVGFKSDTHRSALGWRRVPYLWFGSMLQFGGLAIMPFSLLVLSGDTHGPAWVGTVAAALAFVMVGAGLQTTQTAGLALATDLAPAHTRPRVVALMYVMLLVGMLLASVAFGWLLRDFSQIRLIQVVQGAAVLTMVLNTVALWKQEPRRREPLSDRAGTPFGEAWRAFAEQRKAKRFLVAVGLGTAAFQMQDIILEPYGGTVLQLPIGATSLLTAMLAAGALSAFAWAARRLQQGVDPHRLAALGALVGVFAFAAVIFAAPMQSSALFRTGAFLIGFGGGLFAVCTLISAMDLADPLRHPEAGPAAGLVLGAWGAVQAGAGGVAIGLGGALRDGVAALSSQGLLGPALEGPEVAYSVVYHIEIALLFATLIAIGPMVRQQAAPPTLGRKLGLAEFPG
ncbi:PucC family protein [Ideonella sp. DXS29W]|uniref:PucC family protein n=1 Tax=Ideonella lacteola TaxID=2984193 RepID=A0ABU9BS12_9BURK